MTNAKVLMVEKDKLVMKGKKGIEVKELKKLENLDRYKIDTQVRISIIRDEMEEISLWELAHDVVFHILRERGEKLPISENNDGVLVLDREWVKEKAVGITKELFEKVITQIPDFVNKTDSEIKADAMDEVLEYIDDAVDDLCGTYEWEIN
jgi:hypothetical protein|nr:MAG TPA: hypothetical protein [Caudoviricetes sp.]